FLPLERGCVRLAPGDHPLDERPHLGERRVRLVGGEVTHRCNPMHPVDVEAVTIDAFGTLVALVDPVPALRAALAARGVERTDDEVGRGFQIEAAYYRGRSHHGRNEETLALLRRD